MKSYNSSVVNAKSGGVAEMLAIAMPMIASNTCDMVMLFTDRLFLSRLGPEYMSAALGGGVSQFLILSFFFGLIGYSSAVTAQYFGAGDKKYPSVTFQAVLIALISYPLVMLVLLPLGHALFSVSGITKLQLDQQKPYFDILMAGSVLWMVKYAFNGFFTGIGRTRVILFSSLVTMCANVVMCYAMVFGKFGMPMLGIRGAAYSTVLSSLIGLAIVVWQYIRYSKRMKIDLRQSFRYNREIIGKIIRFGLPAGTEMLLSVSAFTAMVFMFQSKGLAISTAVTIVFNWDNVAYVPLLGLEVAVTSLFGRYLGAGRPDIAQKVIYAGLRTGIGYSLFVAAVFVIFPHGLTNVFRPDNYGSTFMEVEDISVFMIRMASIYVSVEALIMVYAGALRGAGDTFWAMMINVCVSWLIVIAMYFCLHVFNVPIKAAWVFTVVIFLLVPVLMYLRFRTGKWKEVHIIE